MPVTDSPVETAFTSTVYNSGSNERSPMCQPCTDQTMPCNPGYICFPNSTVSNPTDGIMGYICPAGYYCPAGALEEIPCPIGSYSSITGASECMLCPPGYYCSATGQQSPTGPCNAGYFCTSGSQSPTPVDGACPQGHYCPTGSASSIPCPAGTVNPVSHGTSVTDCVPCPGGYYCSTAGLTSPTGHCNAGYFCTSGSQSPTPVDGACPEGHYCPPGSALAIPCPVGTMNPVRHGTSVSDCRPCQAGYNCETVGVGQPDPVPSAFSCTGKQPGLYADPADCSMFNECVLGHPVYHRPCAPGGTVYDPARQECRWPYEVSGPCRAYTLPASRTEPFSCAGKAPGHYPDPASCSRYYQCTLLSSAPFHRDCPPGGLVFDAGRQYCTWPWSVAGPCGNYGQ
ncbi:multiple epidermal growth factor-like domains protein 11 isoform X1 [Branchiostoma lanceolatum]|uniref:multiple epidermal growth factor-like domains protein 11 isoform X1 n=1 Tax=Branchiostoma lanceolatum TaxID=7740 RepID=UPI003451728E